MLAAGRWPPASAPRAARSAPALRPHHQRDAIIVGLDRRGIEPGGRHDLDAALLEARSISLGISASSRGTSPAGTRARHFAAHVAVVGSQLDAHGAAADHDDRWPAGGLRRMSSTGDDGRPVGLQPGQRLHPRARGEDDVLGLEQHLAGRLPSSTRGSHTHPLGPSSRPRPRRSRPCSSWPGCQPLHQPGHELVTARRDGRRVGHPSPPKTELGSVLQMVEGPPIEHGLGRDAADMQAGAADAVGAVVDQRDPQTELTGTEGSG